MTLDDFERRKRHSCSLTLTRLDGT